VGGIEAGAAMLGQPVTLPMPEVVGFHMSGRLPEGVTATDLTLRVTQMLREKGVVDKLVEFYGEGVEELSVADRATIANMAPEYGATAGFFPVDERTLEYLHLTGRSKESIALVKEYLKAQHMFGIPKKGEIDYTAELSLDLHTVEPSLAGPKRPQDRISLKQLKPKFLHLLQEPSPTGYGKTKDQLQTKVYSRSNGGFSAATHHDSGGTEKENPRASWSEAEMTANRPFTDSHQDPGYTRARPSTGFLTHGSVVIAAITSCTNTSNPSVMIGAGLLAKKAVEKGLKANPFVKTSLAPGSRVVTEYLKKAGLDKYLDKLGFQLVGYGCTTCIGNSGPLDKKIEDAITMQDLIAASVLSGNRNFEARIHSAVKANFLMSPPLVIAFAIAGRVDIDFEKEPIGTGKDGSLVFLRDIWPDAAEIEKVVQQSMSPEMFKERYARVTKDNPMWGEIKTAKSALCHWDKTSTYIQHPPYFENFHLTAPKKKTIGTMHCLAIFGDSVTTDHISPAGAFDENTPAGQYLMSLGITRDDFNSYGSRRGNHQIMMRGTFANVRIKNKMMGGKEGGYTKLMPEGLPMTIYDSAMEYAKREKPLIIFAGKDYGMGSSRDWAAKGTLLLGVKAVVAQSFERIHRSNLVGMGVLPLEFMHGESAESHGIKGTETFTLEGLGDRIVPRQEAQLHMHSGSQVKKIKVLVRIDTPIEVEYYLGGGIMAYVLRQVLAKK
jgi:aconitate hydratase